MAVQTARMVDWITADGLTDYDAALAFMEARVAAIHAGQADEAVWLVEHPPLYTAGTSAKGGDLLDARFRCMSPGGAGNTPITGRASESSMSCWT